MRRILYAIASVAIVSLAWCLTTYAAPTYPQPTGFVVDAANIIDDVTEARILTRLSALEATSTSEIAVATVSSLEDLTVEEYATGLFQYWGVGKAKQDNGVLLLVALNEHKVRIEVGYGLEGALTDLESSQIVDNILIPAFKRGNYNQGVDDAVTAIAEAIQGEYGLTDTYSSGNDTVGSIMGIIILLVFGFIVWVVFSQLIMAMSRTKSIVAGGILGGGLGAFIGLMIGSLFIGAVLGSGFGALLDWAISRLPSFRKFREKAEKASIENKKNWPPRSGGFGGFGGGGSSGGGFGGFGGGRSGGGGSSGSW